MHHLVEDSTLKFTFPIPLFLFSALSLSHLALTSQAMKLLPTHCSPPTHTGSHRHSHDESHSPILLLSFPLHPSGTPLLPLTEPPPHTRTRSACTASPCAWLICLKKELLFSQALSSSILKKTHSFHRGPRVHYASKAQQGNKHLIMLLVQAEGQCGSVGDISSIVSLYSHQLVVPLLMTTGHGS